MAHQDSPQVPPGRDRRRVERIRLGPLRVRLHGTREGSLIDISELGALVRLPTPQTPDKQISLHLEWKGETVELQARVIRSTPHRVELPTAVLARTEYQVALEFSDLSQDTVTTLRRIIGKEDK